MAKQDEGEAEALTMRSSLLRQKSSNSLPLVSVTSDVFFLESFGGSFSCAFHPFLGFV